MKYLKNPTENLLEIVYGDGGQGAKYIIKPEETVMFDDEAELVARRFKEIYGFLEVLDEKEVQELVKENKFKCKYCGRDCKTALGLSRHEEACKKKNSEIKFSGPRRISPKAKSHKVSERIMGSRSEMENEGFGNTDLQGIAVGAQTKEKIGGKTQKVVYDRDGVAWYGPGVEDDMSVVSRRKAGSFS